MQELPPSLMTLNLHLAQHLPDQDRARGPPALDNEMYVEQSLQPWKACTRHRVSRRPEAVVARQLTDNRAMMVLARKPGMLTFDQHVSSFRCKELVEPHYDSGSADGTMQMLHLARPVWGVRRQHVRDVLMAYSNNNPPAQGQPACLTVGQLQDHASWQIFTAARTTTGLIQSRSHTRASRVSCFVTVEQPVQRSDRTRTVIAEVLFFLRVMRPPQEPLRLAICRTYAEQPQKEGMFQARLDAPQHERVALDLADLGAALVTVQLGNGRLLGVPYFNQSRAV